MVFVPLKALPLFFNFTGRILVYAFKGIGFRAVTYYFGVISLPETSLISRRGLMIRWHC